jgi:hypothetical protein
LQRSLWMSDSRANYEKTLRCIDAQVSCESKQSTISETKITGLCDHTCPHS